jgi:TonB-dependent starch-binding outer membrane protein SusC
MDENYSATVQQNRWLKKLLRKSNSFLFLFLTAVFMLASIPDSKSNTGDLSLQDIRVTGVVTDATTGEPLPGVNILIDGTTTGVVTNIDGNYSLNIPVADPVLVFSYVGYNTRRVAVGEQRVINIELEMDLAALDEVVVIGYGTVRRSNLTGAVSQVSSGDFERVAATNPLMSLQGRAAGLRIIPNSGEPGASASIRIRGEQSISGTNAPIFVVDGIITSSINNINPQDIESVSVLKDASVVAIYGSRAANGVILVETKRGKAGQEPTITFDTYQGIQTNSNLNLDLMNAGEWLEIFTEAHVNAGITPPWDSQVLSMYEGVDTDWLGAVMRTGRIQNHNLSVSGGSERSNYFVSASYLDNQGMVQGMDYSRLNLRLNTDHNIREWIKFGNSLNVFSGTQNQAHSDAHHPYIRALQKSPLTRLYEDDGTWGRIRNTTLEHMHSNALWVAENMLNKREDKGIMGNVYLTLSLLEGLEFTTRANVEFTNDYRSIFAAGVDPSYLWEGSNINQVTKDNRETTHWITDFLLNYNRSFGDNHSVTALLGYSLEEQTYERLEGSRTGTPNNAIRFLNAGDPDSQLNLNQFSDWAFESTFGRLGYTYMDRYIISGTVRRDGTSRLDESNRYGVFPSVSAAWRIAEENFMGSFDWLNELKLRASWGTVGNVQSISTYGTKASLSQWNYVMNQSPAQGFTLASAVNSDLVWESTEKKNIGLDVTLLNNKLYVITDVFMEDTYDLLFTQPIPLSTGLAGSPYINAGQVRNTGIEMELGYRESRGDWFYSGSVNWTNAKNQVMDLEGRDLRTSGIVEGYPLRSFFGYKTNGLIRTQADLDNNPHFGSKGIGDIWIIDIDGPDGEGNLTGTPDGSVNANDRTILGDSYPTLVYGAMGTVGYKAVSMQVQLQGVQGVLKNLRGGRNDGVMHYFTRWAMNHDRLILDRYHAEKNPDGAYPRVHQGDAGNNLMMSDFWLRDASFLRISHVNLNYSLPQAFTQRVGIGAMSAYVSVQNLYTFTKFYGPEVDSNADVLTGVPQPRTWTIGLQASF